jgi:hypothetical protein
MSLTLFNHIFVAQNRPADTKKALLAAILDSKFENAVNF